MLLSSGWMEKVLHHITIKPQIIFFTITVCVHIFKMRYTSFVSFRGVVGGFGTLIWQTHWTVMTHKAMVP